MIAARLTWALKHVILRRPHVLLRFFLCLFTSSCGFSQKPGHPKHDASISAKGKHGNKPGSLFQAPVFLDG